MNETIEKHSFK
jgi:hypothetical protein